jgi:hypothetical protein
MRAVLIVLSCVFLCGCFTRSQVISRGSFDDIQVGSPVADFEQKVGKPYRVRKLPNGNLDYEYIEKIFMGEEIIEENHYYLRVKNGRVIAKRMNQEIPPAYDLIYDADPNDTDLQ